MSEHKREVGRDNKTGFFMNADEAASAGDAATVHHYEARKSAAEEIAEAVALLAKHDIHFDPNAPLSKENAGLKMDDLDFANAIGLRFYVINHPKTTEGENIEIKQVVETDSEASTVGYIGALWGQLRHAYGLETPGFTNSKLHTEQIIREYNEAPAPLTGIHNPEFELET